VSLSAYWRSIHIFYSPKNGKNPVLYKKILMYITDIYAGNFRQH